MSDGGVEEGFFLSTKLQHQQKQADWPKTPESDIEDILGVCKA